MIRNSTAVFLIFTGQIGEQSIEARYEDETVWLTQKLMAELFAVDVRTVSEQITDIYATSVDYNRESLFFREPPAYAFRYFKKSASTRSGDAIQRTSAS